MRVTSIDGRVVKASDLNACAGSNLARREVFHRLSRMVSVFSFRNWIGKDKSQQELRTHIEKPK